MIFSTALTYLAEIEKLALSVHAQGWWPGFALTWPGGSRVGVLSNRLLGSYPGLSIERQ